MLIITPLDQLSVCKHCKTQFKFQKNNTNVKRCYCSCYTYNSYSDDGKSYIVGITRSVQNENKAYILIAGFSDPYGGRRHENMKYTEPVLETCKLQIENYT